MHIIYLSPHLDDAAISCGGLIWQQARQGHAVEVWSLCAGDTPPGPYSPFADELHARWGTAKAAENAARLRREEDIASCNIMGAAYRHFPIPDCIYRVDAAGRYLYPNRQAIFGPLDPAENALIGDMASELERSLPAQAEVICPLAIGNHVDHQLTRAAAERLGCPIEYYADYPYAEKGEEEIAARLPPGLRLERRLLDPAAMQAWVEAVMAHASQISSFWANKFELKTALQAYHDRNHGVRLWKV